MVNVIFNLDRYFCLLFTLYQLCFHLFWSPPTLNKTHVKGKMCFQSVIINY